MASMLPTETPELLSRLDSVGTYSFQRPSWLGRWIGVPAEIEWESPTGFANDLAPISVALWFPSSRHSADDDLRRSLAALDGFRGALAEHVLALESYLVECFRECYEDQLEESDRQRLADAAGAIPDAAILRDVQSINIRIDATAKAIVRTAWVAVGWDEEHGIDVEWDESGEITRPWRNVGDVWR